MSSSFPLRILLLCGWSKTFSVIVNAPGRVREALKEGLGKAGCATAKTFKPCLRQTNSLLSFSPV